MVQIRARRKELAFFRPMPAQTATTTGLLTAPTTVRRRLIPIKRTVIAKVEVREVFEILG
jgi:hypothetical protein